MSDTLQRPSTGRRASSARGATRLREAGAPRGPWTRAVWSGAAVTVATLAVVLIVVPMVKGRATVSAAEILAKSATQLAQRASAGIELLEYELVLDGVPRGMMPDNDNGTTACPVHRPILPAFRYSASPLMSPAHVVRQNPGRRSGSR